MEENNNNEGKSMFSNIWGNKFSLFGLIIIVLFFLAMISLRYCDSKHVVVEDDKRINIITQ
ncbi:hypothetical protein [Membranihabitans maritimus]|uniref:hypothetical protein n=1 Tax=Membranihabitans maritimus TaxID=2904244 RepID=UPI001F3ACBDC|nr:hypothetical protein [Membranihabitans maritimus]